MGIARPQNPQYANQEQKIFRPYKEDKLHKFTCNQCGKEFYYRGIEDDILFEEPWEAICTDCMNKLKMQGGPLGK